MKFGVIVFPGSNCDDDMVHVLGDVMGQRGGQNLAQQYQSAGRFRSGRLRGVCRAVFPLGDYVRAGAIAHLSIMQAVKTFADAGGYVFRHLQWFPDSMRIGTAAGRFV